MDKLNLSPNNKIAKAAGSIMLAFIISNVIGLIRQILVANVYGTGFEIDAFNAANRVAETIFNLAAGGALASAFIPTLTGLLSQKKFQTALKLISAIFNLLMIVLFIITIIASVFAPQIVRNVLAPGFSDDPLKEKLTENLLIIMLPSAILFSLSGLLMSILNSHQIFFIPALTPSMYQVGMIIGILALSPIWGIYGLAWGVVIGALLHLLLQIPTLLKLKLKYYPDLGLQLPEVREVVQLMLPRLFGVAIVQINFWVNTRIASRLPEGSITGLVLGFSLMLMPQAAIAQSIAIAALPTLSSQFSLNKLNEFRSTLAASLRGVLLLSIPASAGLIILGKPIITLLYQRGEFNQNSVELVNAALTWYAAGLVGHCMVEILSRAFYAMHNTKTPVIIGILAMSLNVFFSYLFSWIFNRVGWMPHSGLAFANSLATLLELIALFLIMKWKLGEIEGNKILQGGAKAICGTLLMVLCLWFFLVYFSEKSIWLVVFIGGGISIFFYVLFLYLIKLEEFSYFNISEYIFKKRHGD